MRALIFELRPGQHRAGRPAAGPPDPRRRAPGPHRPADRRARATSSDRLPLDLEEVLYRISQEALHNVVKHAAARQVDALDRQAAGSVSGCGSPTTARASTRRASPTATSASPGCGPGPRRSARRSRSTRGPAPGRRSRCSCPTTRSRPRAPRRRPPRSRYHPANARHRRNDVGDLHTSVYTGIGVACPTLAA